MTVAPEWFRDCIWAAQKRGDIDEVDGLLLAIMPPEWSLEGEPADLSRALSILVLDRDSYVCSVCWAEKPEQDFRMRSSGYRLKKCKACESLARRDWRRANVEHSRIVERESKRRRKERLKVAA